MITVFGTSLFFGMLFIVSYLFLKVVLKPEFFMKKKDEKERYEVVVLIIGNLHHVVASTCVLYTIFYMCDYPFAMFNGDEMCLRTYKPFYSHLGAFTCGYFVYDLFMQLCVYQDFSPLGYQNIAHHCLTWMSFVSCWIAGHNTPMQSHITMICEFSQIFLNIRNTIGKKSTGTLPLINNLCFFFAYTLFRVIMFPILLGVHFQQTKYYDLWNTGKFTSIIGDSREDQFTPVMSQIGWILTLIFFTMVVCLNFFWYSIIMKGMIRLITKGDTTGGKSSNEDRPEIREKRNNKSV